VYFLKVLVRCPVQFSHQTTRSCRVVQDGRLTCAAFSAVSSKRKRKVLTINIKLVIFESLSKGVSQARLTTEYGVGKSMISDIHKNWGEGHGVPSTLDSLESLVCMVYSKKEPGNSYRQTIFSWKLASTLLHNKQMNRIMWYFTTQESNI